ncbi:MAG: hypothetical protein ACLUFV_08275 [Acutalibacteraceae bacterium]
MLTKSKSFLYIVLALAAGVALLLLPGSGGTESKTVSAPRRPIHGGAREKVASLIGELDGVKDCSVAITLAAGYEYLYASTGGFPTPTTNRRAAGRRGDARIHLRRDRRQHPARRHQRTNAHRRGRGRGLQGRHRRHRAENHFAFIGAFQHQKQ